jgi:hypothetical protein
MTTQGRGRGGGRERECESPERIINTNKYLFDEQLHSNVPFRRCVVDEMV